MTVTLQDRLSRLRILKEADKTAAGRADVAHKKYKDYEAETWNAMRDVEVQTTRTDDALYVRRSTIYATVQDQYAFEEWCRSKDLSEAYLEQRPAKARLNEMVRDLQDTGQEMPPGIGWYPNEFISITNTKESS